MAAEHGVFAKEVIAHGGRILSGEGLMPTSTATTVRGDGAGGHTVTDGPFVETKEAVGGFYVVDAADLDQAMEFARLCPAYGGGVEIRPVMDTSGG